MADMLTCETMPKVNMKKPCISHNDELNGHLPEVRTCKEIGMQTTAIRISLTAKFVINMFGIVRRQALLKTVMHTKTLPTKAKRMRQTRIAASVIFTGVLRPDSSTINCGYSSNEAVIFCFSVRQSATHFYSRGFSCRISGGEPFDVEIGNLKMLEN